jgi:hypothetical protein
LTKGLNELADAMSIVEKSLPEPEEVTIDYGFFDRECA